MTNLHEASVIIGQLRWARRKVIVASGYFNMLHVGHLRYLHAAKMRADSLVVVVNNDKQVALKGSFPLMPEQDRLAIVAALRCVDDAVLAIDEDRSISKTLEVLRPDMFANGGDVRCEADCREAETCRKLGIEMIFGIGGSEKLRSSSDLLRRAVSAS